MLKKAMMALGAISMLVPLAASAESSNANGAGALSTSARLDFQVTVPRFLYLRVGTAGATIDQVAFDLNARLTAGGFPGDTTNVAGTGGDAGGGAVNARVVANTGQVTITPSAAAGGLTDGGTNTIPFTEILTASSSAAMPAPTLVNGAGAGVQPTLVGGNRTDRSATWTYTFDNEGLYEPGTYGGVNTNGSRVTYTAATP